MVRVVAHNVKKGTCSGYSIHCTLSETKDSFSPIKTFLDNTESIQAQNE